MKSFFDQKSSPVVEHDDIMYPSAVPFVLLHLACIAAFRTGVTYQALAIGLALYWLRIFAIGAGYHRYFYIEPIGPAAFSSLSLPAFRKVQRKRACYGGRRNTVIII